MEDEQECLGKLNVEVGKLDIGMDKQQKGPGKFDTTTGQSGNKTAKVVVVKVVDFEIVDFNKSLVTPMCPADPSLCGTPECPAIQSLFKHKHSFRLHI